MSVFPLRVDLENENGNFFFSKIYVFNLQEC
jgi:hypothetical protein